MYIFPQFLKLCFWKLKFPILFSKQVNDTSCIYVKL